MPLSEAQLRASRNYYKTHKDKYKQFHQKFVEENPNYKHEQYAKNIDKNREKNRIRERKRYAFLKEVKRLSNILL